MRRMDLPAIRKRQDGFSLTGNIFARTSKNNARTRFSCKSPCDSGQLSTRFESNTGRQMTADTAIDCRINRHGMPDRPPIFGQRPKRPRPGGSPSLRDRSSAYLRLRQAILAAEPLCRYCRSRGHITSATMIDHIIALVLGGSNDRANLAPACQSCNASKSVHEKRFIDRGYDVRDILADPQLADWIKRGRDTISNIEAK